MSDATLTILLPAITTIAVSVVLPLCMAGLALLQWWLSKKQELAAKNAEAAAQSAELKVQQVKNDLQAANHKADGKIDSIARVADATHILVNNNMQIALDSYATMARRMATATGDPKDIEIAESAEQALLIHKGKQANLDSAEAGRAKS